MTATNHALSGAVIGLYVTQPVLAIPLAFISHFVLDALPHVGLDEYGGHHKAKRLFRRILFVDALLLLCVFGLLIFLSAPALAFICAIVSGSPDFIWAYRYIFKEDFGNKKPPKMNAFNNFHARIQTSQTLKGLYAEIPLAGLFVYIIVSKL